MPVIRCPKCTYSRSWKIRRGKRKCKKCGSEFSLRISVLQGFRLDESALTKAALTFVVHCTVRRVMEHADVSIATAQRLCHLFRLAIDAEDRIPFLGPAEVDETYIGAQRKNQRLHIRKRYPPKRGHGTQKLPIIGALDRTTRTVRVAVMARKLDKRIVLGFVRQTVVCGARIFTDGFPYYRDLKKLGYRHEWVDHNAKEYVRGEVHTNGIEGFWGFMKRRMGNIGGMRRDRLGLFATELAWRYNRRELTDAQKACDLVRLVKIFGGRI